MRSSYGILTGKILILIILFLSVQDLAIAQENRNPNKKNQKGQRQGEGKPSRQKPDNIFKKIDLAGNVILGCPTKGSIIANVIVDKNMEAFIEYSKISGDYKYKTTPKKSIEGEPVEISLSSLEENTKYYYRVNYQTKEGTGYKTSPEYYFYTQRKQSSTFSFGVQGDSHPERAGKMFNSDLYSITMQNVISCHPDFYFTLGDDFSIDRLINNNSVNQNSVDEVYANQRQYLGIIGSFSHLFLVNGNHEQAAKYLLDGTQNSPALIAAKSRVKFYPLPTPDSFYSGNSEKVDNVGLLKDYYAFEWGDALFVTIDFYWHSNNAIDNIAGKNEKVKKNPWEITLGEIQYIWFKQTLEKSKAKFKFVFCHHVLGTGRGGVERAKLFEWGGYNQKGDWEFDKRRPGWETPIHQLMVKNGVTILFQGHDHLFCKQELDGVIYQSVPNPADNSYTVFNSDAYISGNKLPNSGFLNITVSPAEVKVDYIRSFLPSDEAGESKNGVTAYSYTLKSKQ